MTRSQARFKYGEVNSMHPSKSRLTLGQRVKEQRDMRFPIMVQIQL